MTPAPPSCITLRPAAGSLPETTAPAAFTTAADDCTLLVDAPSVEGTGRYRHIDARGDTLAVCEFNCAGDPAPAPRVFKLHHASVYGREGITLSRDGVLYGETQQTAYAMTRWAGLDEAALRRLFADERPTLFMPGRYFSLLYSNYRNWYHWLVENVSRLRLAEALDDANALRIIIPDDLPPAHLESLLCLGVDPDRLVRHDGRARWVCETLYVPSFPTQGEVVRADSMAWLRARILPQAIPATTGPAALFISRAGSAHRHIVNEDLLRRVLEPKGVTFVNLDGLPFLDQVRLMASARMVAGVHGAGLSDIIFAPEGSLAVELVAQREEIGHQLLLPRMYRQLALACGVRYLSVGCVDFKHFNANWTLSGATVANLGQILGTAVRAV